MSLSLQLALRLIDAAMEKARSLKVPVYVAVVDQGGHLVAQQRMDGAILLSETLSRDKAYTAATTSMSTDRLGQLAQPGQPFYGLQAHQGGRVVLLGGGYPLQRNGQVVGAIGVSGGSADEDMAVAVAGRDALADAP